jgi:hypothetical protein
LEARDAVVRILELVHVPELATKPEHPFGRLEDLHDLIATLIRLEQNRAAEGRSLAEQICGGIHVPAFDGKLASPQEGCRRCGWSFVETHRKRERDFRAVLPHATKRPASDHQSRCRCG